ncbi:MAG: bifunctional UDP-N-acetylglucosamine diphosphorylase/glucosamine-1-phosphate N-acetyltransferase GlmU [Alphaproteobacteria bacterium]|nr:bifunctional UDP-N-acetylglucosamine diphosphorylase/glucosamine-1-phosphate N-acetyltransferase GlmU [Alphaproteobacteria bacterium]
MNLSAIILAAGEGSRMKSSIPKVMHKVASRSMVGHILDLSKDIGTSNAIAVVGPRMGQLEDYIRSEDSSVRCVVQEKRLGTADAVKIGMSLVKNDDDILVLYGDTPFVTSDTIERMKQTLKSSSKSALVVLGFNVDVESEYGRLVVNKGSELEKIVEYLDCDVNERDIELCNSGVMLINGKYAKNLISKVKNNNAKKEYYLTDLVEIARKDGLLCHYVAVEQEEALAVNTRQELAEAEYAIQTKMREDFIKNGVTLIDPETIYFAHDTKIENDVTIYPNVFFGLGVEVKSGAVIKSFSHIESTVVGKDATVGPFANLRPGTVLEENTKVGNFVEIKNSHICKGTKISHLSYIGDSEIGSEVNIGAGTITCNYDGIAKHKTIIGEGSFIGSNSSIVAPINIGSNSMIAAGSVITEDVADGDLSVARSKQKNFPNKAQSIKNKKVKKEEKNARKAL